MALVQDGIKTVQTVVTQQESPHLAFSYAAWTTARAIAILLRSWCLLYALMNNKLNHKLPYYGIYITFINIKKLS